MSRSAKKILRVLLVNVLVLAFLSELLFTAYYWIRDGAYYSVRERIDRDNQQQLFEPGSVACKKSNKFGEHPYLAYVHVSVPECNYMVNNTGHRGEDFPFIKDDSNYVILWTGGSAALQLANMASPSLAERLQKELSIQGKEIVFLNGAMEGWKQPQQMILIMQYLPVIDLVLAYEGFNELTISRQHDYRLALEVPAINLYRKGRLNKPASGNSAGATAYQAYQGLLYEHPLLRHSQTAYFLGEWIAHRLNEQAALEGEDYVREHFPNNFYLPENWSYEQRRQHLIDQYAGYVQSIAAASRAQGVPYLHFIQPVPALDKVLTDAERAGAADISYDQDYRLLEKRLLGLSSRGVQVSSLVNVFQHESDRVYKDAVHLRMDSNAAQIVMDRIVQAFQKSQ